MTFQVRNLRRRALLGSALSLHLLWTSLLMGPPLLPASDLAVAAEHCHQDTSSQSPHDNHHECHCAGNLSGAAPLAATPSLKLAAPQSALFVLPTTLTDTEPERVLRPPING